MALEGPLRELGIHDVFQLLDLSRKTGMLRVSSELREDEGLVFFDNGKVVLASIRSTAMPTEIALLQAGRITESDLTRARVMSDSVMRPACSKAISVGIAVLRIDASTTLPLSKKTSPSSSRSSDETRSIPVFRLR